MILENTGVDVLDKLYFMSTDTASPDTKEGKEPSVRGNEGSDVVVTRYTSLSWSAKE